MIADPQVSQWTIPNLVEISLLVIGIASYILNSRTEAREARASRDRQTLMHGENAEKLTQLLDFRKEQERLNRQRDEQINVLTAMAGTTATSLKLIAEGLDRRAKLLEDEMRDNRNRLLNKGAA